MSGTCWWWAPGGVQARRADLCCGRHPGRRHAADRTVFKSLGSALEDLAAAVLAWQARAV